MGPRRYHAGHGAQLRAEDTNRPRRAALLPLVRSDQRQGKWLEGTHTYHHLALLRSKRLVTTRDDFERLMILPAPFQQRPHLRFPNHLSRLPSSRSLHPNYTPKPLTKGAAQASAHGPTGRAAGLRDVLADACAQGLQSWKWSARYAFVASSWSGESVHVCVGACLFVCLFVCLFAYVWACVACGRWGLVSVPPGESTGTASVTPHFVKMRTITNRVQRD